jgi:predicted amidohydrolase
MEMIQKEYERNEKTVTVSVVNFNPVWGDKAANLQKIKTMVISASQEGSNIIAFPELALSGYECGDEARQDNKPCSMHDEAAETIPGPSTEEIAKLTKELGIYVFLGMPERDKKDPEVRYISVAVVGPEGILGKYRKIHLAPLPTFTERVCFKPGNELPVFETKYGRIGVQICADFWVYPELSRILCLKGARLIINCAACLVNPTGPEFIAQITGSRGTENFVYAASASLAGKERTLSYYGRSTISGREFPSLKQIFAQGGDGEEIVSATLSFEKRQPPFNHLSLEKERIRSFELCANELKKLAGSR